MSLTSFFLFIIGLILLVAGAEVLVRGASKLAVLVGISPLVIGLTIVAFGTSSPELAVSVIAGLSGNADISLGNVVGSNIFNILAVLGLSSIAALDGIIDDLYRSGATLNAVTEMLYTQGSVRNVYVLTLTKTRSKA